eukprot:TRINITY_DN7785_c0_g1_i2.p1 TRINITY_DN7785_c0_g1~~TRINITY_DN7785_c0_g1_i2.p1  ORF type:complete len:390 (+),score=36.18 TRINITY_DN7785_c0_g1_i2:380-1549(+)
MIIHESKLQSGNDESGLLLEGVCISGQKEAVAQVSSCNYLRHELDKSYLQDGRKCSQWFLIDDQNTRHLAVIGEERDTRDGHYTYRAEGKFKEMQALSCTNVRDVYHYLEQFLTHRVAGAALVAGQDVIVQDPHHGWSTQQNCSSPQNISQRPKASLVMNLPSKGSLQRRNERQNKRRRIEGKDQTESLFVAVNEVETQSRQEMGHSIQWLKHVVTIQEKTVVEFWCKLLEQAIEAKESGDQSEITDLDAIEALRELYRMPMTLSMLASAPNLIEYVHKFIRTFTRYAKLGHYTLRKWKQSWIFSTAIVTSKDYRSDIFKELEVVRNTQQQGGSMIASSLLEESIGNQSSQQELAQISTAETEERTASKSVPAEFAGFVKTDAEIQAND